jgi:hypothetical protein
MPHNAEGRPVVSRGRPAKSVNSSSNDTWYVTAYGPICKPRVVVLPTGAGDAHAHTLRTPH